MPLPERLGRLERGERLGVGGFATVWRYHDLELDSDVAVKALAENWAQRLDVRERFLDEARILRRADSDHVVHVYDIGEVDETPYFVMSYADLGSLARLLPTDPADPADPHDPHDPPDPPLPIVRVCDLVTQAGLGLEVLHDHGVVHRDIKPQNLLLRSNGGGHPRLLVADLGVAKAMLHASGLTQVVGTPAYMAPEQATGGGVDVRADVHALAAVAYQMLTGRLARDGTVADLAQARPPVPPSRWADLPAGTDEVLLTALDPDPGRRYADVRAFVEAFRAALAPPGPGDTTTMSTTTTTSTEPERETLTLSGSPRSGRAGLLLALLCLVVFGATFAAAYAVTAAR